MKYSLHTKTKNVFLHFRPGVALPYLIVADGRIGGDELFVLDVLVVLPEPVVLAEPQQVLVDLVAKAQARRKEANACRANRLTTKIGLFASRSLLNAFTTQDCYDVHGGVS